MATRKTTKKTEKRMLIDCWELNNSTGTSRSKIVWGVDILQRNGLLTKTAYNKAIKIKEDMLKAQKYFEKAVADARKKRTLV